MVQSWLKDVASVLKDGGVLFLVIPDKRFTFDIRRDVAYFEETPQDQLEFYVGLRKSKNSTRAKKLRSLPKLPKPVGRHELEEEIERLRTDLHNFYASRSWRITKPIRVATTGIKKLLGRTYCICHKLRRMLKIYYDIAIWREPAFRPCA